MFRKQVPNLRKTVRVRVLHVGKTYTYTSYTPIEYGIVNEKDANIDVVILTKEPPDGLIYLPDYETKILDRWVVRNKLLILRGVVRKGVSSPIVKLSNFSVYKSIPVSKIVDALMRRGEELRKKIEAGEPISDDERYVNVDGIEFEITVPTNPEKPEEVTNIITYLFQRVTSARKRVFLASPAFIEILRKGSKDWYVVTIPYVIHFIKENPEALAQVGIIDPEGFKAPYLIVTKMIPQDLADPRQNVHNVMWLDKLFTATLAGVEIETEAEEVSPFE